jgi:hypothetical protein
VRHTVIAGLSTAAVALVVLQSVTGFGLERMVRPAARQAVAVREKQRSVQDPEEAKATTKKPVPVKLEEELELAKYNLSRTMWMHLAVTFTVLGALAAVSTIALESRGNKPPPKLVYHY